MTTPGLLADVQRLLLLAATYKHSRTRAAELLGMSQRALYDHLTRIGVASRTRQAPPLELMQRVVDAIADLADVMPSTDLTGIVGELLAPFVRAMESQMQERQLQLESEHQQRMADLEEHHAARVHEALETAEQTIRSLRLDLARYRSIAPLPKTWDHATTRERLQHLQKLNRAG
jgi:hypothetical protein